MRRKVKGSLIYMAASLSGSRVVFPGSAVEEWRHCKS